MPPTSVYIGRTNEKRFKGTRNIWFWAVAVSCVLATAIILAAT